MEVLKYGNNFLKIIAKEVKTFDENLEKEANEMYHTMIKENGIGLAATQVGIDKRLIVIDVRDDKGRINLVNPIIISKSQEQELDSEGCLSVPGIYIEVRRPAKILIQAQNLKGQQITINAEKLLARAIQHEIDHLNGVLFLDQIDELERKRLKSKLKKIKNTYKQINSPC